jgi:hypothetical protein
MTQDEHLNDLIERMRALETDHSPDGWPAVQMRDITALCDEIDRRHGIGGELIAARRERDYLRELYEKNEETIEHELKDFLFFWTHDSALQTVQNREKFRAEAKKLLGL